MVIEQEVVRRKKKLGKVERAILGAVGVAGVLTVGAVAPGALSLLGYALKAVDAKRKQNTEKAFKRLIESGELTLVSRGGKKYTQLTKRGKIRFDYLRAQQQSLREVLKKTKRRLSWDGRWRIIAFDIKEYRRNVRDQIRRELQSFGLIRLQQSMWIFPYDCSELITLLKADYKVGRELLYIRADQLEQDTWLRKHFHLSLVEGKDVQ